MREIIDFISRSLLAGFFIGLGCIAYALLENHIIGSFLFSLGLITVIIQNALLYTGKIGYIKLNLYQPMFLILMLLINLTGIWVLCYMFYKYSGLDIDTTTILALKYDETIPQALIKSIGCGIMMYIAVDGYAKTKDTITVILPVMTFILCGFDHCIANYGYMGMNGNIYTSQLPIWIIGNAIGSIIVNKLTAIK